MSKSFRKILEAALISVSTKQALEWTQSVPTRSRKFDDNSTFKIDGQKVQEVLELLAWKFCCSSCSVSAFFFFLLVVVVMAASLYLGVRSAILPSTAHTRSSILIRWPSWKEGRRRARKSSWWVWIQRNRRLGVPVLKDCCYLLPPCCFCRQVRNGCLQIPRGNLQEEAVRPSALLAASQDLAIPPLGRHPPCLPFYQARQSPPPWIQGQARICHLPCPCQAWRSQAPSAKGCHLRQASSPGCKPTEIPA